MNDSHETVLVAQQIAFAVLRVLYSAADDVCLRALDEERADVWRGVLRDSLNTTTDQRDALGQKTTR